MQTTSKKRKHLTEEQKTAMVSFMELHGDLCLYKSADGRKQKLIKEFAETLNNCSNGVVRTPKQWLIRWNDKKCKSRAKAIALRRQAMETSEGVSSDKFPLTPWEERIVRLAPPLATELSILETRINEPVKRNNSSQDIRVPESNQETRINENLLDEPVKRNNSSQDIRVPESNQETRIYENLLDEPVKRNNSVQDMSVPESNQATRINENVSDEQVKRNNSVQDMSVPESNQETRINRNVLDEPVNRNNSVQDMSVPESNHMSDYFHLSDHEYTRRHSSSSESPPISEILDHPNVTECISSPECSMEEMMKQIIKAQEATSNSILQLADAIREGCKTIAESISKTPQDYC